MPRNEIKQLRDRMEKALAFLHNEYLAIRTGRAHPGLVSDIKADYYGTPTPLKQMANITIPEARKLQITPFDRSGLKTIEKAILASNLGITPQNDGECIRLTLPELTRERRVELTKLLARRPEEPPPRFRRGPEEDGEGLRHHRGRPEEVHQGGPGRDGRIHQKGRRGL